MHESYWFKLIMGLSVLVIAVSVGYYFFFFLPATSRLESESQQCQRLASSNFAQNGFTSSSTSPGMTASFIFHYNQHLNQCFMLLFTSPSELSKSMFYTQTLYDALSNKEYAEYDAMVSYGDFLRYPLGNQSPTCKIFQPEQECHSQADFDNYIKPYVTQ